MEYTQEQLDEIIREKVKEATKGMYTKDDLDKEVTREVDRRVESGIQKGIETQRTKWENEFKQKAQMTAEELAKAELEGKMSELTGREKEIAKRTNMLSAKELLNSASIPKEHYTDFLDVLVLDDEDATKEKVNKFVEMFNKTRSEIEARVKSEISNVPAPSTGGNAEPITKEAFNKMGYAQKIELKQKDPDTYKTLMNS